MSVGHRQHDPAPVSLVLRMLQLNPGLRALVGKPPLIDRSYRVPYGAGRSRDGRFTYIDSQTPERFAISGVEPDEHYADHEGFEWFCMVHLGMDYDPASGIGAHRRALGFEHYRMRLCGISDEQIEQYEKESAAMINLDEHIKLPPEAFPPDLYLGVYEEDEDVLDRKLLPVLRAAQMIGRTA